MFVKTSKASRKSFGAHTNTLLLWEHSDSTEVDPGVHLRTSGMPHGLRVINKRKAARKRQTRSLQPTSFALSAAKCFIVHCAVPIFSSCRDYSNQASALKTSHLGLTKERTDIPEQSALCFGPSCGGHSRRRRSDSSHPCHRDRH